MAAERFQDWGGSKRFFDFWGGSNRFLRNFLLGKINPLAEFFKAGGAKAPPCPPPLPPPMLEILISKRGHWLFECSDHNHCHSDTANGKAGRLKRSRKYQLGHQSSSHSVSRGMFWERYAYLLLGRDPVLDATLTVASCIARLNFRGSTMSFKTQIVYYFKQDMIAFIRTQASFSEFRDMPVILRECFDADWTRANSDQRVSREEIDLLQNQIHHLIR